MPPPRQRPADDSRSEASSGTAGAYSTKPSGPKSRKTGNNTTTSTATAAAAVTSTTSAPSSSAVKDLKIAAATGAAAAAAAAAATASANVDDASPSIAWSQMPLSLLHDYRHAHKLATPSAYARPISRLLLSSGVGLRSPTAIAARRAALSSSLSSSSRSSSTSRSNQNNHNNTTTTTNNNNNNSTSRNKSKNDPIHKRIPSQNRIAKDQLALSVRKHFNAAGLVEQEAIARFLYKVREEGKGREFRLRFQP